MKPKGMKRPRDWHHGPNQDPIFRRNAKLLDEAKEAWEKATISEHPDAVTDKNGRLL